MEVLLIIWAICIAISAAIGASKDRVGMGIILGVCLGLIGAIIMLFIPESTEQRVRKEELTRHQMRQNLPMSPPPPPPTRMRGFGVEQRKPEED